MRANRAAHEARQARSTGSVRRLVATALAEAIKRAGRGEGPTMPRPEQDERGFPVGMDEDVKQALTEAGLDRAHFSETLDKLLGEKADPPTAAASEPGAAPADPADESEPPSHLPEELRDLLRTAGWRKGDVVNLEKNEDGSMSFSAAIKDRPGVKNEAVVAQIAALKAKAPKGSVVTVAVIGPDSKEPRDADGFPVGIDPELKKLMQANGLAPAKSHHVDASDTEAMQNRTFSALLPQAPGAELVVSTVGLTEADAGELHALMNGTGAPRVAHLGKGFLNLRTKDATDCTCEGCKMLRGALPLFERGEVLRTQAVVEEPEGYYLKEPDVQH